MHLTKSGCCTLVSVLEIPKFCRETLEERNQHSLKAEYGWSCKSPQALKHNCQLCVCILTPGSFPLPGESSETPPTPPHPYDSDWKTTNASWKELFYTFLSPGCRKVILLLATWNVTVHNSATWFGVICQTGLWGLHFECQLCIFSNLTWNLTSYIVDLG